MKYLIICVALGLFICLIIGACGKLLPSEQRQDAQWSLGDYDYYCAGMHYKVLSRYAGGVTVINITLDSLKLHEYQLLFRDSIATYGGGGASGIISIKPNNNK